MVLITPKYINPHYLLIIGQNFSQAASVSRSEKSNFPLITSIFI
ncbi:MAG: hypothetical protein ACI85N_000966, partial [Gammaproteobacteria bacterium]